MDGIHRGCGRTFQTKFENLKNRIDRREGGRGRRGGESGALISGRIAEMRETKRGERRRGMWEATATKFGIDRRHCPPPLFVGSRVVDKGCDSRFTALSLKDSRQNWGGGGGEEEAVVADSLFSSRFIDRASKRARSVCLSLFLSLSLSRSRSLARSLDVNWRTLHPILERVSLFDSTRFDRALIWLIWRVI